MTQSASSTFTIDSWKDEALESLAGRYKPTRASVAKTYSGEMSGFGRVEYLMANTSGDHAEFVGIELFEGQVGKRAGSFMLRHEGTFDKGVVRSRWHIVADSGRDELEGIAGHVDFVSGHAAQYDVRLVFELR